MKKIFSVFILLFCGLFTYSQVNSLQLQGIIDFDLISAGYTGKALHLKVNSNISDLSNYGIGVANNGNGGDGQEYSFPSTSAQAGDHILLARDTVAMSTYLNVCFSQFDHILLASNAISQNGNDAIELFKDSVVIETFGDINVDGTGTAWEYLDSWAYRTGSFSSSFNISAWTFGGVECTLGSITTQTSSCPYLFCGMNNIENNLIKESFNLYPNPSNDYINLVSDISIHDVKIFDSVGKEFKNFSIVNNTINIKSLPTGFYIFKFLSNNILHTQTFIKK